MHGTRKAIAAKVMSMGLLTIVSNPGLMCLLDFYTYNKQENEYTSLYSSFKRSLMGICLVPSSSTILYESSVIMNL